MGKGGSQKRGSKSTKTRKDVVQDDDDEIDACFHKQRDIVPLDVNDDTDELDDDDVQPVFDLQGVDRDDDTENGELPPGFEESLARSIANEQKVVKEDVLSSPVSSSVVGITQDTSEPVKIDKSREDKKKKREKRKHQNDQVDMQSEELLKLRTALEGKLRSNGVFGSTVSKSDKAQKRKKLANRKLETFDDQLEVKQKMVDNDGESEDEFYKQVKQKQEAKRAAKAEIYSRKPSSISSLPESVKGKRLISNEMDKNRGLTRHRNKALKTPRVNNRRKYNQKVIHRKGQVRDIRKPLGPSYGGEGSGINPNISRSIRFKN